MGESLSKLKWYWLCTVMTVLMTHQAFGQNLVNGKVTDIETGEPLIGVTIGLKGTNVGTVSDVNGNFTISAPSDGTLVLSFIGLKSVEVPVGGRTTVDINMESDISQLEEVVVIGYAAKSKKDVTAAVASVDVENMTKRSTADLTEALQGTVTGAQIYATDNSPGAAFNFNIRGISSPEGAAATPPLVIVDGVQISGLQFVDFENVVGAGDGLRQTTGLENINPQDIESMEILKDASAAAIYGSRAANGVIIITTKRGKKGAPQVSFNTQLGTQVPFSGPSVANSEQYIQIMQGMYGDDLAEAELVPQAALDYIANPSQFSSYDWYDLVYNSASTQTYDLAVAGGGDFGTYRISAGYKNQGGIALGTNYERGNVRANSEFNINDKLKIGQTLGLSRSETLPEPYAFSRSVYYKAIAQVPYFSPYGINPDPTNDPTAPPRVRSFYWGGGDNPEALIRNPLDYQQFWSREIIQDNIQANLFLEYEVIEGLKYKISGSFNQTEARMKTRTRTMSQPQEYFNCERCIEEGTTRESNWILDNILTYSRTMGNHSFNIMGGYVVQEFTTNFLGGFKSDFLSDITSTLDGPGANPLFTELNGNNTKSRLNSIIGQAFYSFKDKYQVTVNFRRDGSSSFDESVRWGNFPGVSAGWRISNEGFWSGLGLDNVISEFKIRGGYGVLGRQNSGVYPPVATLSYLPYSFGGTLTDGLITPGPVNTLITWEESKTTNIGFDFGLLDSKITGSFDYFQRETDNLVSSLIIPGSAGGGEIVTNDGLIKNNGVEFEINYSSSIGEVNFNVGLNASYVDTELTSIPEPVQFGEAPEWDVPHAIEIYEGRGPSEFWLIKTDGIFKSQAEIDAHVGPDGGLIQPDAQLGDVKFIDFDGDGIITTEGDRQFAGTGRAPWNGGLNLNVFYRSFDFTMNLFGNFGHHVFNGPRYLIEQAYGYDNFGTALLNAYDPVSNPDSNFPRNNPNDLDENWNSNPSSDRYLEKGSFVKASLIEVGYSLPTSLTDNIGVSSARVSFSTQNLFTITGYEGIDPQQGRDGWFSAGIDRGTTPQYQSFLLNLSVTF
jgi:TonB-linked SusC/RagA family outer membrane protein